MFPFKHSAVSYLAGFILATVGLHACNQARSARDSSTDQDTSLVQVSDAITTVKTAEAKRQPFEYHLKTEGKIRAAREQIFISETAGKIAVFAGANGRRYGAGNTIAVLDQALIKMKLERAELSRFNASREYESQLLGYQELLKGRPLEEQDSIRKKLRIATGLAVAEQDIRETREMLNHAIIKAPFNGVLSGVLVQQGSHLSAGERLFTLYTDHDLYVETEVMETDFKILKPGLVCDLLPVSERNAMIKGVVENIDPYVNAHGMVTLRIKIMQSPADARLFPGMHCSALVNARVAEGIVIPKAALVKRNEKPVVFTYANGKAIWNDVSIGHDNGKEVEITGGLKAGEKVIITNNLQLVHESAVKEESQ
ncbi:efflux RND transporter periplasmic adaptor subunit [Chitinophaga agri]|uniref:Efflux RND transporter periplasmic adaptor subunit n=1 Tax=Chitinophaga agri TaxID=2703787 RepID=A0A6B9ZPH6_9BACT|nr:efflux RND transporter periplasmic adaptor subunit [Chitinophaga agri]QHS63531.1 efflux RND transporter periplasmic adaptor subunit [Chitinophaga agri]